MEMNKKAWESGGEKEQETFLVFRGKASHSFLLCYFCFKAYKMGVKQVLRKLVI